MDSEMDAEVRVPDPECHAGDLVDVIAPEREHPRRGPRGQYARVSQEKIRDVYELIHSLQSHGFSPIFFPQIPPFPGLQCSRTDPEVTVGAIMSRFNLKRRTAFRLLAEFPEASSAGAHPQDAGKCTPQARYFFLQKSDI